MTDVARAVLGRFMEARMQDDSNDIPRLPDEDVVDRSTETPDVAHDDERLRPGNEDEAADETDEMDDDELNDEDDSDLDTKMTD
jgi:hypothetical protein